MGEALNRDQPQPPSREIVATPETQNAGSSVATIGGRLIKNLEEIADKLFTLRVTTVIGAVNNGQITETPAGMLQVNFTATPIETACTTLDMALGNITEVRSQQFCDNSAYAKLHDDSLTLARAVRGETMDLIIRAVEAVKTMAKV